MAAAPGAGRGPGAGGARPPRAGRRQPRPRPGHGGLATLGLADNELDTLGSDVFGFCGQLRTLDLSGNKIYHLEGDTFRGVR